MACDARALGVGRLPRNAVETGRCGSCPCVWSSCPVVFRPSVWASCALGDLGGGLVVVFAVPAVGLGVGAPGVVLRGGGLVRRGKLLVW